MIIIIHLLIISNTSLPHCSLYQLYQLTITFFALFFHLHLHYHYYRCGSLQNGVHYLLVLFRIFQVALPFICASRSKNPFNSFCRLHLSFFLPFSSYVFSQSFLNLPKTVSNPQRNSNNRFCLRLFFIFLLLSSTHNGFYSIIPILCHNTFPGILTSLFSSSCYYQSFPTFFFVRMSFDFSHTEAGIF